MPHISAGSGIRMSSKQRQEGKARASRKEGYSAAKLEKALTATYSFGE